MRRSVLVGTDETGKDETPVVCLSDSDGSGAFAHKHTGAGSRVNERRKVNDVWTDSGRVVAPIFGPSGFVGDKANLVFECPFLTGTSRGVQP